MALNSAEEKGFGDKTPNEFGPSPNYVNNGGKPTVKKANSRYCNWAIQIAHNWTKARIRSHLKVHRILGLGKNPDLSPLPDGYPQVGP